MQIVYEWEDVLSRALGLDLADDFHSSSLPLRALRRLCPAIARSTKSDVASLVFEMSAWRDIGNDKSSIVPCIIDFFIRDERELRRFYRSYRRNPLVLVSSMEAFEFLKERSCPMNIQHWALSIPDKWIPDCPVTGKLYDVAIMGRENPVLMGYLEQYMRKNPRVSCVRRIRTQSGFAYRSDSDGKIYPGASREDYMRVMRMARVGLYATPGMDGAKPAANGFNQVTPRFLEFISSGCSVLARYQENPDTRYYGLSEISPSVETYEQFEHQMEIALSARVDFDMASVYLRRHSTSVRAQELKEILTYA